MLIRLSIVTLLFFVSSLLAITDTTCSSIDANVNATAILAYNNYLTPRATNSGACCSTCGSCSGYSDCCGYDTGTNKCYYCTTGTCCGSINDLTNLGCCGAGTECCLDCTNTTVDAGLYCEAPGSCSCNPTDNSCVAGVCCPNSQVCGSTCCDKGTCCGTTCCESGTCCGDTCCESGSTCCNGQCCQSGSSCCSYTPDSYYSTTTYFCCSESGGTCCGSSCCSNTQACLSYYDFYSQYYCCNANVTFTPSTCNYDYECPGGFDGDWDCCYGCCCPSNYTCDDKTRQCIYVIGRSEVNAAGLAIGLGYGLGFGIVYSILLCCIPKRMALTSLKPVFKKMGYVSGAQFVLVFTRLILYAIYPFSEDFKVGIAAISTGFWVYLTGMLMVKRHYEQWLVCYGILFTLNFILNLACFFMEFINLVKDEPAFAVLVAVTVIVVLIDIPWTVYFLVKIVGEYKNPSSTARKRNKVELLDHCKPKSTISAVASVDTAHSLITKHFYEAWTKGSSADVNIHYILKLKHPRVSDAFRSYKKKIAGENQGNANVQRVFHATKLSASCKIATSQSLCKNADCSVCGISRKGFKVSHSGLNIKFSRFGQGIYFAPNSSKANDYNSDPIRAMFYVKVVLGKQFETEYDKSDLVDAPTGFHSVYGKVGARLNYPEVVVYTEQAVKPTHLIIYSVGGVV